MRLREFLDKLTGSPMIAVMETIANRPRTGHYYLTRAKELRQIQAAFDQAAPLLDRRFHMEYELNKVLDPENKEIASDIINLRYDLRNSTYGALRSLKDLADNIETYIKYANSPGHDFFKYIPDALQRLHEEIARKNLQGLIQSFPSYSHVLHSIQTNEDWRLLDADAYDPENIEEVKDFLEAVRILEPAFKKMKFVLADLTTKIKAQQDFKTAASAASWNGKPVRPTHDEVEILYHATVYANEVAAHGFATEKPIERLGVGNLGRQTEISFTHDLKIAMDIMRALKELTMIANGQLKARTIADWIRRENIPNFPWHEFMKVNKGYNDYFQPQYEPTTFDRFDIVQTAKLYEKYIWLSTIHPNPVFISIGDLVKTLVGRPINDIGVLACEVRLNQDADSYHSGESEFRVKPEAVLSVKRVM